MISVFTQNAVELNWLHRSIYQNPYPLCYDCYFISLVPSVVYCSCGTCVPDIMMSYLKTHRYVIRKRRYLQVMSKMIIFNISSAAFFW